MTGWRAVVATTAVAAMVAAGWLRLGGIAAAGQEAARSGPQAPELQASEWLNSKPLSLAGLRGRVVAVEFWTFG